MLLLGTLLFLITVSVVHLYVDTKKNTASVGGVSIENVLSWSAQALVLGLTLGSLSLSSFEASEENHSLYNSLIFLWEYGLVLILIILIVTIWAKCSSKEES